MCHFAGTGKTGKRIRESYRGKSYHTFIRRMRPNYAGGYIGSLGVSIREAHEYNQIKIAVLRSQLVSNVNLHHSSLRLNASLRHPLVFSHVIEINYYCTHRRRSDSLPAQSIHHPVPKVSYPRLRGACGYNFALDIIIIHVQKVNRYSNLHTQRVQILS